MKIFTLSIIIHFYFFIRSTSALTASTNSTVPTAALPFSQYDLFKNTGFSACKPNITANATIPVPSLAKRRGSSGGGSSHYSNAFSGHTAAYIVTATNVGDDSNDCFLVNGTNPPIVVLPTAVTQYGFFPGWPTYLARFISLTLSFYGFFHTWKRMAIVPRVPTWFWIQAVVDTLRVFAWIFITIWGWQDPNYFSWTVPLIFLIPSTYIWLIKGMRIRLRAAGAIPSYNPIALSGISSDHPMETIDINIADEDSAAPPPYESFNPEPPPPPFNDKTTNQPGSSKWAQARAMGRDPRLYYLAMFLAPLAFVMWLMSFLLLIQQHSFPSTTSSPTVALRPPASILTNPSLISPSLLLASCATWLHNTAANATGNLGYIGLLNGASTDATLSAWINLLMWLAPTSIAAHAVLSVLIPRTRGGRNANYTPTPLDRTIHLYLRNLMLIVAALMLLGLVVTSALYGSRRSGKQSVSLRYTLGSGSQTGGCTWLVIGPDLTWGGWDISETRWLRILLAVLGV